MFLVCFAYTTKSIKPYDKTTFWRKGELAALRKEKQDMETSADRQEFLFRAAQSLSTSNDTNKLFANVVTLVRQLLKADRATLFIADREGKWVVR